VPPIQFCERRSSPACGLLAVDRAHDLARDRALVARKARLLVAHRTQRLTERALGPGGERRQAQVDAEFERDAQRLQGLGALALKGHMPPRARACAFAREAEVAQRAVRGVPQARLACVDGVELELLGDPGPEGTGIARPGSGSISRAQLETWFPAHLGAGGRCTLGFDCSSPHVSGNQVSSPNPDQDLAVLEATNAPIASIRPLTFSP